MEIERKFLVDLSKIELSKYHKRVIEQGYLSTNPVVRVRRDNDDFYMTYKSEGQLAREEYNLPLTRDAFYHLLEKADGNIISKERFEIPYEENGKMFTIELDVFNGKQKGLVFAEVEYESEAEANAFVGPKWFTKDVTDDERYYNRNMI